jgi:hypothetical protein
MQKQFVSPRSEFLSGTEKIIAVYRGWDNFERAHGGPEIIDFDLTEVDNTDSFTSREEILSALENLAEQLDTNSHEGEFLHDKLQGSIFYLRAILGQQIPFNEYARYTIGISVTPFSDHELEALQNEVNDLLSYFGIELKAEDKEKFETTLTISDPEKIKRGITDNQEFWLARLRDYGVPTPQRFRLNVEFVEVDAYWSNWINGSFREGVTLRINIHPRKKYELGRPLMLCLHEICGHALQMTLWKDAIAGGVLNPACGLTTVHSPEAFVCEGLGQTVADFLSDENDFPREFWLTRRLQYYTLMVLHNAHLMIYESVPAEEILQYAETRLPFTPSSVIEAEMRDRRSDPLYRTYQLTYAAGEHMIKTLTRDLTPEQKRLLLRELYSTPMTPKQLTRLATRIRE